jgi:glycosyltransferase involved in cell wall biosynthesis
MSDVNIVVGWNGLPAYGAHLVQAARENIGVSFPVLGTQPDVPIEGMEDILGDGLLWLEAGRRYTWSELGLEIPDLFVHTGWRYPHFISLADEVREAGGRVVGMFDNCWKGGFRQLFGGLYFRLFMRKKYHAAWVPGRRGMRLARYLGFAQSNIYSGMYGASGKTFKSTVSIEQRSKQIIYVGRLNERKGILELVAGFRRVCSDFPDWRLLVIGAGELEGQIQSSESIELQPFQQPAEVAKLMNDSRIFALASREEHWGLVVHEATLCGCALLLQKSIGAVDDLALDGNAVIFERTEVDLIENAFRSVLSWSAAEFVTAAQVSSEVASGFGPDVWAKQFERIVEGESR